MSGPFAEIALLLVATAAAGALAVQLRQPVLVAYIVVGILLGPAGFGLVRAHDEVDLLAQIGVTVLLFVVGLGLDFHQVRHIGPVALATGLGQLGFTIAGGFVLVLLLGYGTMEALYIAVALTFSSTIIIVKLLSDKRELDSLHGRIAVGFLIVQDIAVVMAMMAMSALGQGAQVEGAAVAASLVARIAVAAVLLFVLMRYVLPRLARAMARSQELLLIFAVAWGTALAALGEWVGFSKEAGAFLAGFSLASSGYREAIGARVAGIRDFLLLFFFIDLGARLELSTLGAQIGPALVLSVFVLVGNPLIVMGIMGFMGYRKRTGFLAGLTVAQISEFSIVFVAMGIGLGHVGSVVLGLVTLVGLATILLSTYMILYSEALYVRIAPWLGRFERRRPYREMGMERAPDHAAPRVIVFGLGRYGARLLAQLKESGVHALGVDFDPENVRALRRRGLPAVYGDGEDPELVVSLPVRHAQRVVTTLPQLEPNRRLLQALREAGYTGGVTAAVRDEAQRRGLTVAGVDQIFNSFNDAADHAARQLVDDLARTEASR